VKLPNSVLPWLCICIFSGWDYPWA
jgi:hypothetical protein